MDLRRRPPLRRGLSAPRRGRLQAVLDLELEHVAVTRTDDAVGDRKLVGPVDDHEPARPGLLEGADGLLGREMTAQSVPSLAALRESRLTDEEIGLVRELGAPPARSGVARIRPRHQTVG